jgi:hypothetical protein
VLSSSLATVKHFTKDEEPDGIEGSGLSSRRSSSEYYRPYCRLLGLHFSQKLDLNGKAQEACQREASLFPLCVYYCLLRSPQTLPDEIQLAILLKLPLQDIVTCSSTSKDMSDLCLKNQVWEALFTEFHSTNDNELYEEVAKEVTKDPRFWRIQFEKYYGGSGFT